MSSESAGDIPGGRRHLILMMYLVFPFPALFPPFPHNGAAFPPFPRNGAAFPPRPLPRATLPCSPDSSSPPVVLSMSSLSVSVSLSLSSFFLHLLATSSALNWNHLRPFLGLGDLTGNGALSGSDSWSGAVVVFVRAE